MTRLGRGITGIPPAVRRSAQTRGPWTQTFDLAIGTLPRLVEFERALESIHFLRELDHLQN